MKKRIQKLPDSELDVMLALWNGHPDMTRLEVEAFVNQKKELAPTTILSMLTRLESKKFVSVKGKSVLEKLYGNSLKNFVASLYQGKQIHEEDIQELEEFLKELERKGE